MPMDVSPVKNSKSKILLCDGDVMVHAFTGLALCVAPVREELSESTTAEIATTKFKTVPMRRVPLKPKASMKSSGTIAPATAPARFARYRKLKERFDLPSESRRIANIANGIVAPMHAHHGIKVTASHAPATR